jgi:hypothetical protein
VQGRYLHRKTQNREKTQTYIHVSTGIRNHDPFDVREGEDICALDRTATVIGVNFNGANFMVRKNGIRKWLSEKEEAEGKNQKSRMPLSQTFPRYSSQCVEGWNRKLLLLS